MPLMRAQQARTQHRRERERNDSRDDHSAGNRHTELAKQPARQTTHEQQGEEHDCKRDRGRDHRHENFPRARDAGLDRSHAIFDLGVDVLEHDDRIVHDETDREDDPQERERIDRETGGLHDCERAYDGHRDRHDRNQRCAPFAQEREHHEHHEHEGDEDGLRHLQQRAAHILGVVVRDVHLDIGRYFLADLFQPRPQRIDDLDLIRTGLLFEIEACDGDIAHLQRAALVLRAQLCVADIAEAHDVAAAALDDEPIELLDRAQPRQRLHWQLNGFAFDPAGRQLDVFARERLAQIERRESIRGKLLRIDPQTHCIALFCGLIDAGDTGYGLQSLAQ